MKAIISSDGTIAIVVSETQRFVISAGPIPREHGGGYSVGIDSARIATVPDIEVARNRVLQYAKFFAETIMEVK